MTEEQKWLMVNESETLQQLQEAIMMVSESVEGGPVIRSNRQDRTFRAEKQIANAFLVIKEAAFPNILTRAYGICQQAIYIRTYEQYENNVRNFTDSINSPAGNGAHPTVQATPANSGRSADQGRS